MTHEYHPDRLGMGEHDHGPEHDHTLPDATTIPESTEVEKTLAPLMGHDVVSGSRLAVPCGPGWWDRVPPLEYGEALDYWTSEK